MTTTYLVLYPGYLAGPGAKPNTSLQEERLAQHVSMPSGPAEGNRKIRIKVIK